MHVFTLFATTALVFLTLDAIMLIFVMSPLFERYTASLLLPDIRLGAAIAFYLVYVVGVLYFVSVPSLVAGSSTYALLNGALLGALAYGTYEFTNYATLKNWAWQMVAADVAWGALLTGFSAWAGVIITRAIFPQSNL